MVMDDRKEKIAAPKLERLEDRLMLSASNPIENLQTVGDLVIYQGWDGNDDEIFVYDGEGLHQLTDNDTDDINPHSDGTNIVWQSRVNGGDYEIMLYDGSTTTQLTENTTDDVNARTDGTIIAWFGNEGVYIYNYASGERQTISSSTYNQTSLQVAGGMASWYAKVGSYNQIYLYDGVTDHRITNNHINNTKLAMSETHLAWRGANTDYDDDDDENPDNDDEIFLYDIESGVTTRITQNTVDDIWPCLSDKTLFWLGETEGNYNYDVFAYDLSGAPDQTPVQLTFTDSREQGMQANSTGAVWVESASGQIYAYKETDGSKTQLTNDASNHNGPSMSSEQVVWEDGTSIWLMDTTRQEPLIEFTHTGRAAETQLTISDVTEDEGDNTYEREILVSLSNPTDEPVIINYTTVDGTAESGSDYEATSGTLTFLPGDITRSIKVNILGNVYIEHDESFSVNITSYSGATLQKPSATVTLLDDDTPEITVSDAEVIELDNGTTVLEFVVTLSQPAVEEVTVSFTTKPNIEDGDDETDDEITFATVDDEGTYIEGADYSYKSGTLTFAPNSATTQTVRVTVYSDDVSEYHETMLFELYDPGNATITDGLAIGTILNDDVDITFSENSKKLSKDEGKDGQKNFTFTVELSNESAYEVKVDYRTEDITDSAISGENDEDRDYESTSGTLIFAPGETSKTFTVTVFGDEDIEDHESFKVILENIVNARIAAGEETAIGEIFDDDAPRLTISDVTMVEGSPVIDIYDLRINEGHEGFKTVDIKLTLSRALTTDVIVEYDLLDLTADYGEDYTNDDGQSGTVTFAAGQTDAYITLKILGDTDEDGNESNESFKIRLGKVSDDLGNISDYAALGDDTATVTIYDDDHDTSTPRIYCYDYYGVEGDSNNYFSIPIGLSMASNTDVTVYYSISDGTATGGEDYVITADGYVTFSVGETLKDVTIEITGDDLSEGDKTFFVTLSNPSGATIADSSATGVIIDDDPVGNYMEFTVTLSKAAESDTIEVDYTTAYDDNVPEEPEDGEDETPYNPAEEGTDYAKTEGTLTFEYAESNPVLSHTIKVPIYGDRIAEEDETFKLVLSNATATDNSNPKIINEYAIGTLTNDDTEISFETEYVEVSKKEGNSGTTTFEFYLQMSHQIDTDVKVYFTTSDGTAISSDVDDPDYIARDYYEATFTNVDRSDDDDSEVEENYYALLTVNVKGDTLIENNEEFTITLVNAIGGTLVGDLTATATILDDDTPIVSISDAEIIEGDSGSQEVEITIELSRPNEDEAITISYETLDDGSANAATAGADPGDDPIPAGIDYIGVTNGSITFEPGETSKTITIIIAGDTDLEADETFLVHLTSVENGNAILDDGDEETSADDDTATVTIKNNDTGISVHDLTVTEGTGLPTTARIKVELTEATTETVTAHWQTRDGNGENSATYLNGDYNRSSGVLTFLPGETVKYIEVQIYADAVVEQNEHFEVFLHTVTNAELADGGEAEITIQDDDMPWMHIDDAQITEGDSDDGTVEMEFTVTLHGQIDEDITVDYHLESVTAILGEDFYDFTTSPQTLTFAPGEDEKIIKVVIVNDDISEEYETFKLILSNASSNATISDAEAIGTIVNDDAEISIADAEIEEGSDGGTLIMPVTLTLSHPSVTACSVVVTSNSSLGSATENDDYIPVSQTVTFAPGEISKTIDVIIISDKISEEDPATGEDYETFTLALSDEVEASIGRQTATAKIIDDDEDPMITIDSAIAAEGDIGTTTMDVVLTLSNPSSKEITVTLLASDDTAYKGIDYLYPTDLTATFLPGETTATIPISIVGNNTIEADKYFNLMLTGAVNASISTEPTKATIRNDDTLISIPATATVQEGDSGQLDLVLNVSLSEATTFDVTFDYWTSDITAIAGEDYVHTTRDSFVISAGQTSGAIRIPIIGDNIYEGDETFTLTLANPHNAELETLQTTITIVENETVPEISIEDVEVTEGDSGTSYVFVTLTLNNPSSTAVSVEYATSDISATAGIDYISQQDTVNFAPRQDTRTISIGIIGDTEVESAEQFWINLFNSSGATLSDENDTAIVTINDNDTSPDSPTLSIADAAVAENNNGTSLMEFIVTLSREPQTNVTVNYRTYDDTATLAGSDYSFSSGTLNFSVGQTTASIFVEIKADQSYEFDETFTVTLSQASGAVIDDGSATGTIVNDDDAPQLSIDDISVTENDLGTQAATITVTLSNPVGTDVNLDYTGISGTATLGLDFSDSAGSLIIPAGQTSAQINFDIIGDELFEGHEYFDIVLSNIIGADTLDGSARVTILDNDSPPAPMADLMMELSKITVPALACPGQVIKTKYYLRNIGQATASGYMSVSLYCSSDLVLDASDMLLSQTKAKKVTLKAGKSKSYGINLTVPANAPAEDWHLIAVVNTDDNITDSDDSNNAVTAPQTFNSPWQFGAIPGGKTISLPVTDTTGQDVRLYLSGGGWGEVVGREGFTQIILHDTTVKSTLTIKSKNEVSAGAIIAENPIKSLSAPKLSLSADSSFTAGVIRLLNITDDTTLSLGKWTKAVTMILGGLSDASVVSQSDISKLVLYDNWTDSDSQANVLTAPSVKSLVAKGNFAADINSGVLTKATIYGDYTGDMQLDSSSKIIVKGDMTDSTISLTDPTVSKSIAALYVYGQMESTQLNAASTVSSILAYGVNSSNLQMTSTGKIKIKGDMTDSDISLTDPTIAKSISGLYVYGMIESSELVAASTINAIQANGIYSSDFFAGLSGISARRAESAADFTSIASINKVTIKGEKKYPDRYLSDSNFSAAKIGTVSLINGDFSGSQVTFNALADGSGKEIKSIKHTDKQDKTLSWKYPGSSSKPFEDPYDIIRIL